MMPGYEDPRYTGTTQPSDRSVASTHHTHKQARAGKNFFSWVFIGYRLVAWRTQEDSQRESEWGSSEWSWGGHCTGQRPHIILKCFRLWRKPMGSGVQLGAKRQTVAKHSNLLTKIKFKTNCATNRNHCEKISELVDIGVEDTLYLLLKLGWVYR